MDWTRIYIAWWRSSHECYPIPTISIINTMWAQSVHGASAVIPYWNWEFGPVLNPCYHIETNSISSLTHTLVLASGALRRGEMRNHTKQSPNSSLQQCCRWMHQIHPVECHVSNLKCQFLLFVCSTFKRLDSVATIQFILWTHAVCNILV